MEERRDPQQQYVFSVIQLFKKDTLGTGSYGAVCKAKCDQLLCAAKLLYPVLFQMHTAPALSKEHRHPLRRFEEECQFLSRINHPNIVQYLGTYRDPDTNIPVLLMELMDESLTHFLESSPEDVPYHTQINFSYDIAQALAFLHSNGIIHRDLSSNNVLLLVNTRAKVTDFGMSKFTDLNATRLATMTTCPGTPVFMSPEALNEPPVYTEKLDNFSFGVLLVQIATRQFPKPTDRFEMLEIANPRFPNKLIQAKIPVPELERRQAHIGLITSDHPLLPTALHCLKDEQSERPTATQLCQTLTTLKKTTKYPKSSRQADLHQLLREKDTQLQAKNKQLLANQEQLQAKEKQLCEKDEQLLAFQKHLHTNEKQLQAKEVQLLANQKQLRANENKIEQINVHLLAKNRENAQLATRLDQATQDNRTLRHEMSAKEEKLKTLHRQLQSSEENCAALQQAVQQRDREVSEQKQALASKNEPVLTTRMHHIALQNKIQEPSRRAITVVWWQSLPDIPAGMNWGSSAVIENKAYFKSNEDRTIYKFSDNRWSKLLSSPNSNCPIVSIDDLLTTVGGGLLIPSKKLYSYIHIDNQWVEHFPPMPTERTSPAAVYANNALVVAGGRAVPWLTNDNANWLNTVEILNTVSRQWSSVKSLPVAMNNPSVTLCGDYAYIHPRTDDQEKNSVYKCSLKQLVQSQPSSAIGEKITPLPVSYSSLVTVNGHVLAVGGHDANDHTINIYQYIDAAWTLVGQMTSPRSAPVTAVLSDNKLMVVGGIGTIRRCELANITEH